MTSQQPRSEETRAKILDAAIAVFSDRGFNTASTRDIARVAGVNQGLITYHFKSKEILWQEAANEIFAEARMLMAQALMRNETVDARMRARNMIKTYIRFVSRRPALFRFMIEEGKDSAERIQWLVDHHLKAIYEGFQSFLPAPAELLPHRFYAMLGAGSLLFALAPVVKALTGADPSEQEVIERHADFVADLLVGDPATIPAPKAGY